MEACKKSYGETPEIKQAMADLEAKRVFAAKTKLDKAIKDARTLLLARQYAAAMKELAAVEPLVSAATPELQKQYETMKKDATAGMARIQKEVDLGKTIVAGSADASQTIVSGSYEGTAGQTTGGAAAGAAARAAHARPSAAPAYRPAPPPPKKSPVPMIVIAVLAVAALVGGYFAIFNKPSGGGGAGTSAYIEINAVPWGTVKTVTSSKTTINVNQETPVRVPLTPGEYTVVVAGPDGDEQTQKVTVTNDVPGSFTPVFEKIDVDKILQSQ